jgi:hypothetical protein
VVAEARVEGRGPPARDERGMPEQAQGKAKGHDRDERGIPEHAQGKAKGHDRDERGKPEHSQGKGKGARQGLARERLASDSPLPANGASPRSAKKTTAAGSRRSSSITCSPKAAAPQA